MVQDTEQREKKNQTKIKKNSKKKTQTKPSKKQIQ